MRIGSRFDVACENLNTVLGDAITSVNEIRYLGVFLVAGRVTKFSVSSAKTKFNRAVNSVLSKVLFAITEDLILRLIKVKCRPIPILPHCLEVCDLNKATIASLDFCAMRFDFRNFRTSIRAVVRDCLNVFQFLLTE
jgi:hypothetical protein